jgi:hypothetical protein
MHIRNIIKPAFPHLIAVAIFLLITITYFYPVLEGKVLKTNDGTVASNAAREINDFRSKTGKEPLWTNSMFSGMPAYLISTQYPGNLIKYADRILRILKMPLSVLFLSLLGFYILLLLFRFNPWLAIAGAIAYAFSSYFFIIIGAGHNTKAFALAYMAPMIGSIFFAYRYNSIKGALLAMLFLTLEIMANHPQITYYAFLCLLVFGITEFVFALRNKTINSFLNTSVVLFIPFIIAIGINFASLYTTYEYSKYSIRGKSELTSNASNRTSGLDKDYATQWSYGIDETLTLLIPNFKGGSTVGSLDQNSKTYKALKSNNIQGAEKMIQALPLYWGNQPGTSPVYAGAIVVFLFILGLIVVKGNVKWWLAAATIVSVMLAWGKNFMPLTNLFLDYFPGYNKFRAVSMTLVIAEFTIPLLGMIGLKGIIDGTLDKKSIVKAIKWAAGISGGLCLVFIIIPGIAGNFTSLNDTQYFPEWLESAVRDDRKALLRNDAFRSLIFILLGAGVILAFTFDRLKKNNAILLLALLFVLDMWPIDKRYLNADNFEQKTAIAKASAPTAADKIILTDLSYYRVLNLTVSPFQDASTSAFHNSVGGYHGAKIRRYQELIDTSIIKEMNDFITVAQNPEIKSLDDFQAGLINANALNMLNAKYVIISPNSQPVVNEQALGNAWFVETPVFVENADQELSEINKFNPSTEAIIDKRFKENITKTSYPAEKTDSISLISYEPNELIFKYASLGERLVVFSDIYYPAGWKAYVDGIESNYFRADYVLRAMVVPGGKHEIKFLFDPSSYSTGNKVSLASSILFILLFIGYGVSSLKGKKKQE